MNECGLVWDNDVCLPLRGVEEFLPRLARYRAAGVDVVSVNIGDSLVPLEQMIRTAAGIRHFVNAHPGEYLFGLSTADLREAKSIGMVRCCSHAGYRTAREIIDSSDRPVIFSHSNPRRLRDHPRNIPDDLIQACAATDGVIGINGVGLFLGTGPPTAEIILQNVDYVAQLVGAQHVGLGLDHMFKSSELDDPARGGPDMWPREWGYGRGSGFAPPEVIPEIVAGLDRLGYPAAAIRGILGVKLLRVAETVWK